MIERGVHNQGHTLEEKLRKDKVQNQLKLRITNTIQLKQNKTKLCLEVENDVILTDGRESVTT